MVTSIQSSSPQSETWIHKSRKNSSASIYIYLLRDKLL